MRQARIVRRSPPPWWAPSPPPPPPPCPSSPPGLAAPSAPPTATTVVDGQARPIYAFLQIPSDDQPKCVCDPSWQGVVAASQRVQAAAVIMAPV